MAADSAAVVDSTAVAVVFAAVADVAAADGAGSGNQATIFRTETRRK
jgi:hypothetical protein